MAKAFEILSSIQFSILRLASSHIPAHAVALIQASQKGTVDEVKLFSVKASIIKLPNIIHIAMVHSLRVL